MAIRQRGNGWQVDVTVKGQRVRQDVATRDEALQLEAEIRACLLRGEVWTGSPLAQRKPGGRVLKDALDYVWRVYWQHQKDGATSFSRAQVMVELIGADTLLTRIGSDQVSAAHTRLTERGITNATVNRYLAALSKLLSEAKRQGWIAQAPHIPLTTEPRGRIRWLTLEEEQELLTYIRHIGQEVYADLFLVAVETGARMGELRKLQVRDVDLAHSTVTFWETKNGQSRSVPLTETARQALREVIARGNLKGFQLVFKGVTPIRISRVWNRAKEHMGLGDDPQFIPHALRHTCASRLVQSGVDLRVVKDWMGHRDIQTTLRYAHLAPKNLTQAAQVLEQARGPRVRLVHSKDM